jgi:hypothetical protein
MSELATTQRQNGALAQQQQRSGLADAGVTRTGMQFRNFTELFTFARYVVASGFAPKGMDKPETIVVALQMGMELGLPAMASLQNIAVINGRPSLWGDAQLAVCRATGELEEFGEWYEQGGKKLTRNPATFDESTLAVCRVKRKGMDPMESAFSVADAKRASLWGKAGPWTQYPHRMLRSRARSFALRDTFGDALRGLMSSDEAGDIAPEYTPQQRAAVPTGSLDDAVHQEPGEIIEHEQPANSSDPASAAPEHEQDGGAGESTSPPVAETADGGAADEAPTDDAAKTWDGFVAAAYEIAQAKNIDPDFVGGVMKTLKMTPISRGTADKVRARSEWLGKLASGAKLKADGSFE